MTFKTTLALGLAGFILAFVSAFSLAKKQVQRPAIPVEVALPQSALPTIPSLTGESLSQTDWLERLRTTDNASLPQLYAFCQSQENRAHLDMLAHYWSRTDPEGFLAFLSDNPPFFKNEKHAYHLFQEWASLDFDRALETAQALSAYNPMRSSILRATVKGRFPSNPEHALAALSEIYANAGGSGLGLWNKEGAEKHLAQLAKYPRGRLLDSEIDSIIESWLERDPNAAMEWLQNDIDALDSNDRYVSMMFELAQHDHEAALKYFRTTKSAKRRGEIARNIDEYIGLADPETAVSWIEGELEGWYQLSTAGETARALSHKDPALGADFAIQFKNPRLLKRAVHEALNVFKDRDAQGMQTWANSVTDPTAREAVQAEFERLSK